MSGFIVHLPNRIPDNEFETYSPVNSGPRVSPVTTNLAPMVVLLALLCQVTNVH